MDNIIDPRDMRPRTIKAPEVCARKMDDPPKKKHGIMPVAAAEAFAYTARSVGAWRSPVSALVWGTRGRRFESSRSDQIPENQEIRRPGARAQRRCGS